MNVNKIKNAFSFIGMEGVATKITTLCLISGIGILLFTQHIIFSSSGKALHSPQNQEFPKTDFLREDVINGKAFSGELTHELAVLMSVRQPEESEYPVLIKLDGSQNLISSTKITIQDAKSKDWPIQVVQVRLLLILILRKLPVKLTVLLKDMS